MLLFYSSGRLRVLANLIPLDWSDLENWSQAEEGFAKVLENVLKATNVGAALKHFKRTKSDLPINSISDLSKLWYWSNVMAELVPNIAGKSEGWERIMNCSRNGRSRLLRAIKTLGLARSETQNLVMDRGSECTRSALTNSTSPPAGTRPRSNRRDLSEGRHKKLGHPSGVKVVFPTVALVKSTTGQIMDEN
ncbi:hypothetical protein FB451DRAFT_1169963 [Mycena latifolia]|nr:hypothetical protein FB451DRAFT_1169963 [Mycena latifolia]